MKQNEENIINEYIKYLDRPFGPNYSSIPKQSSDSNFISEDENSIKVKNNYLCKECNTLHLLNIIYEEKKVNEEIIIEEKISIECNKKGKIRLDIFLSDVSNLDNFDNYKFCQTHKENEKIGFCSKCKKDLCQKCKEVNDCEKNQRHIFEEFKRKKEEISEKEKFILDVLYKKYNNAKKTKNETSQISIEKL